MSRALPGEQVEHAFNSKRLQNWETPQDATWQKAATMTQGTRFSTLRSRNGRTKFIVDERGHLLPSVGKVAGSAFNNPPDAAPVYLKTYPRWPTKNPAIPAFGNATMGYKGIQTSYLPTSTVTLKAADIPAIRERNYNFL